MEPFRGRYSDRRQGEKFIDFRRTENIALATELATHFGLPVGQGGMGFFGSQGLQHGRHPLLGARTGKAKGVFGQDRPLLLLEQAVQELVHRYGQQFVGSQGLEQGPGAVPAIAVAFVAWTMGPKRRKPPRDNDRDQDPSL